MHALQVSALLLTTVLAACGGASARTTASSQMPPAASARPTFDDPSCPITIAGTAVSVEDEPEGAALVFVTTGDAADLRRRVLAMATTHNEHHAAMGPLRENEGGSATSTGGDHAGHGAHGGHADHGPATAHDHRGHAGHGGGHGGHADGGHGGSSAPGSHAGDAGHARHAANAGHAGHAGHAGGMIGVHSLAEASDIDGGAKISFVTSADQIAALQGELRMHAQHLASGHCKMGPL